MLKIILYGDFNKINLEKKLTDKYIILNKNWEDNEIEKDVCAVFIKNLPQDISLLNYYYKNCIPIFTNSLNNGPFLYGSCCTIISRLLTLRSNSIPYSRGIFISSSIVLILWAMYI